MKKGCFLSFLTFLTIFLGVVFYLIKNHTLSFEKVAKPLFIMGAQKEFKTKINRVKNSPEKDSLIKIVNQYINTINFDDGDSLNNPLNGRFIDELRSAVQDEKIDTVEISILKDLFNKHIASLHARQKKNAD